MTRKNRVFLLISAWEAMGHHISWQDVMGELPDIKKSTIRRLWWEYQKEHRQDKFWHDMGKREVEVPIIHVIFVVVSLLVFAVFVYELIKSLF